MTERIMQSFTMEDACGQFLASFKKKYKIPKSVVVNSILKYYIDNPKELVNIIIGEQKGSENNVKSEE